MVIVTLTYKQKLKMDLDSKNFEYIFTLVDEILPSDECDFIIDEHAFYSLTHGFFSTWSKIKII